MNGSIAAADLCPCGTMHVQPVPYDEDRRAELTPELAEEAKQVFVTTFSFGGRQK